MQSLYAYIVSLLVMVTVATLPYSATQKSIGSAWYKCIRPGFTPPNYVFPLVWTILYVFIGTGLAETLILNTSRERTILLGLYLWNLALNVAWSLVYFGNHDVILALFIVLNLIVSAVFILYYTYLLLPLWVFWMLLPYVAWLYFAMVLNTFSAFKNCKGV